jgi:cyclin-dependent kinase regulatory subunit CKS1
MADSIEYSKKYNDDTYEYRHVTLPRSVAKALPSWYGVDNNRFLTEAEVTMLGVQQSPGWEHYLIHAPEKHILCFRRPLPKTAAAPVDSKST